MLTKKRMDSIGNKSQNGVKDMTGKKKFSKAKKAEMVYCKNIVRAIELINKFKLTKDDLNCLVLMRLAHFVENLNDYFKKEELQS